MGLKIKVQYLLCVGPWQEASERRNEVWLLKLTDTESSQLTSDGSNSWQQQNFQSADEKSELIEHEVLETTDVRLRIFFAF